MKLLNKKQVAKMLDCSVGKIDTMMRKKEISYIKKGKLVRFLEEDVQKYVNTYFHYIKASPQSSKTKTIPTKTEGNGWHWQDFTSSEKNILGEKYSKLHS